MDARAAHRQAQVYRQRARVLTEAAAHEFRDEGRRRHMLDLAATYQRVADEMAPLSPRETALASISIFSARKPHREPHCIVVKPHTWRFSGIREYCFAPLRRLGNAVTHPSHNYLQHRWQMQRILAKVFPGSF